MASGEVLQVSEEAQTAAALGAGLPAEACPPEGSSVGCRLLAVTSGRPLEDGWTYP